MGKWGLKRREGQEGHARRGNSVHEGMEAGAGVHAEAPWPAELSGGH